MADNKKLQKILEKAEKELREAEKTTDNAKHGTQSLTDAAKKSVQKQDEKKK